MPQTKTEIQALLNDAQTAPRHRFGQNFMIDGNLVRLVANAGELGPADWCLEVGPGTGTLTELLLEKAGRVTAVEIDRDLASLLRQRLADRPTFSLVQGDALAGKHELHPDLPSTIAAARDAGLRPKLVANLPYNIASPLVIELLIAGVELLAFTVQREVADRLKSAAGTSDYGPLSVMAQMLGEVEVVRTLSPQAFWPAPKIESALVRLRRRDRIGPAIRSFEAFVHRVFAYRRKTLRKALELGGYDSARVLSGSSLDGALRSEMFSPEQWKLMWEQVESAGNPVASHK